MKKSTIKTFQICINKENKMKLPKCAIVEDLKERLACSEKMSPKETKDLLIPYLHIERSMYPLYLSDDRILTEYIKFLKQPVDDVVLNIYLVECKKAFHKHIFEKYFAPDCYKENIEYIHNHFLKLCEKALES